MNQKVWFAEMCWFARLRAVVQSWMPSSVMKLWVRMRWETYHLYNLQNKTFHLRRTTCENTGL